MAEFLKGPKGQVYTYPITRWGPDGKPRQFEEGDKIPDNYSRSPTEKVEAADDLADLKKDELEALAEKEGIDIDAIEGSGANGNVLVDDLRNAIKEARA